MTSIPERFIYALVILLSLIALGLALSEPPELLKIYLVYQQF